MTAVLVLFVCYSPGVACIMGTTDFSSNAVCEREMPAKIRAVEEKGYHVAAARCLPGEDAAL